MSMTDPVFQWLAYELAAIFAVLFIWMFIRAHRKHKRTKAAAARTAKLIKNNYEQRVTALGSQLSERYGLSGEALDSMVEELVLREKEIFKSIVNLYSEQDEKTLHNFPDQITSLTDATLSIMQADNEQDPDAPEIEAVDEELVEESAVNTELPEELSEPEVDTEPEEEPVADFDGVFDDENADTIVEQMEKLDDETVVVEELSDTDENFDIELAESESDEVDVDDIFAQNQIVEESLASESDNNPADSMTDFDLAADEQAKEDEPEPEPEPASSSMRMADFLKTDWNPVIPDVYGKTSTETEVKENQPDIETETETVSAATEPKGMKAHLNKAWTNQVPDIYGKSTIPVAGNEEITDDGAAFEHQELKFHAFESDDLAYQGLTKAVQPADIELDIEQIDEVDSDAKDMISATEIDDLMRATDMPVESDSDDLEQENAEIENVIGNDAETSLPEENKLAESDIDAIESHDEPVEQTELGNPLAELDESVISDLTSEETAEPFERTESIELAGSDNAAAETLEETLQQNEEDYPSVSEQDSSMDEQEMIAEQAESTDLNQQPFEESSEPNTEAEINSFAEEFAETDWDTDLFIEQADSAGMAEAQEPSASQNVQDISEADQPFEQIDSEEIAAQNAHEESVQPEPTEFENIEETASVDDSIAEDIEFAVQEEPNSQNSPASADVEVDFNEQLSPEEKMAENSIEQPEELVSADTENAEEALSMDDLSSPNIESDEQQESISQNSDSHSEAAESPEQSASTEMLPEESAETNEDIDSAEINVIEEASDISDSNLESSESAEPEAPVSQNSLENVDDEVESAEQFSPEDMQAENSVEQPEESVSAETENAEETSLADDPNAEIESLEFAELDELINGNAQVSAEEPQPFAEAPPADMELNDTFPADQHKTKSELNNQSDSVEESQTEDSVAEIQAEAPQDNETESLSEIMVSQPNDEDAISDNQTNNIAEKAEEPFNEIDKLRAKLRERTERLKAARQQRLDETQAENPFTETTLEDSVTPNQSVQQSSPNDATDIAALQTDPLTEKVDTENESNDSVTQDETFQLTEEEHLQQKLLAAQMSEEDTEQTDSDESQTPAEAELSSIEQMQENEAEDESSQFQSSEELAAPVDDMDNIFEKETELASHVNELEILEQDQSVDNESIQSNDDVEANISPNKTSSLEADEWVAELLTEGQLADSTTDLPTESLTDDDSASEIMQASEQTIGSEIDRTETISAEAEAEAEASEEPTKAELDFAAALAAEQAQAEQDRKQTQSEIAGFDIPEQPELPEPERLESLLKDVEKLQATQSDNNASLIPPTQETPLPDPAQLENLLTDVDKLTAVKKPVKSRKKRSELQAILSTIPSFSGSNKTKYK
ncbi:hypothetical protein [Methylophaga sp. UBA1490]|uniref:hypothetical protein n=5 Tax=Methylophaga TaxID=40222 RepID=UPI0025ED7D8A|nr:hypothetical protein [Methylophaga sp. UBA1490]